MVKGRRQVFHRRFAVGRVFLVGVTLAVTAPRIIAFQQNIGGVPRAAPDALIPLSDRDAESWLKRAEEAAVRADWKLAADTLARVIDQYGDKTVSPDDGLHFYSAARCALDQIAHWPADGLATYRLLNDSEVRRRLDEAMKTYDLAALRLIVRKFPYSTHGPEAMNLLAAWLLDAHRPAEALDVLSRLESLSDHPIPKWQIVSKRCVAQALIGQRSAAGEALAELKSLGDQPDPQWPEDGSKRVASLEQFLKTLDRGEVADQNPSTTGHGHSSWPTPAGPAALAGRMPPVDPAFAPDDYWRDVLPGSERINPRRINRLIKTVSRPPVWQAASDGRLLFVTCPDGLIARDLATFDFLWRIVPRSRQRDPQIDMFRIRSGTLDANNSDRLDELSTRSLWHEYRGAVSTAYGLVFIIEQSGTASEVFPTKQGQISTDALVAANPGCEPNSIRAFEADTGRAVWTKGRSGSVEDELRTAHFYSPPVAVGAPLSPGETPKTNDLLIAPYVLGDDYFLAVLRPDGTLVRKILLGTGRANLFPINSVLQPTVHEGAIYIPTGAGLFVALNADDFSLRWLAGYERASITYIAGQARAAWAAAGATVGSAQPDEWLSAPPLVAGGLALLAAPDSEYLIAFSTGDGQTKWTYPRGSLRYIVASDGQRVIVAGKYVIAIELATGNVLWMFDRQSPTGRPALIGDMIFVPTETGLVRLNVRSGKEIGDPLPSRFALGNLLSIDGSLYSVTAKDIAKFPDVDLSRRMAHQALGRDPDDVSAMLRLAWLTVLEKKWDAAIELLDQAEERIRAETSSPGRPSANAGSSTSDALARIAHQRVTILLNVASEIADAPPPKSTPASPRRSLLQKSRRELLEEAVRSAQHPTDEIRAGLALCELLTEQKNAADAFGRVLQLLRTVGDEPVALEPQLSTKASVLFRERLCGGWRTMNEGERNKAAVDARRWIEDDLAADRLGALVSLSDALDLRPSGVDASAMLSHAAWLDLRLGRRFLAEGDYETGIFYLERAAERAAEGDIAIESFVRLAAAYVLPGEGLPAAPQDALRALAALEPFGERPLPQDIAALDGIGKVRTVSDFLSRLKGVLSVPPVGERSGLPSVLRDSPRLAISEDSFVPGNFPPDVTAFFDPAHPIDRFDQAVPIFMARQLRGLRCASNSSDRYFWAADNEADASGLNWIVTNRAFEFAAQHAAISNRVALLAVHRMICAVGLVSGRMLWPPLTIESDDGDPPDPPVLCVGGTLIMAPDSSTLIAAAPRQSSGPSWRRRFAGTRLGQLAAVDGRLVAIDSNGETVMVLDPTSGRIQRQFTLTTAVSADAPHSASRTVDPDEAETAEDEDSKTSGSPNRAVLNRVRGNQDASDDADSTTHHVALVGTTVCRAMQDHVIAKDISTGRNIWDTPLGGLVRGLLPLNDSFVGVCYAGSHIAVVDARTGTILKDFDAEGLTLPPLDATFDAVSRQQDKPASGRLLIFARTKKDLPNYALASFPIGDDEQPWRCDLGRLATVNRRMLRASPDYVAAVEYVSKQDSSVIRRPAQAIVGTSGLTTEANLLVIDKASNRELLEKPFSFERRRPDQGLGSGLVTDVIILDERIIAVGPDGYYVLTKASRKEK